jgi:FkbM family methyltransferase
MHMSAGIADRSAEEWHADPAEPGATPLPCQPLAAGQPVAAGQPLAEGETSDCPGQTPASLALETPASPALQTPASAGLQAPASVGLQTPASVGLRPDGRAHVTPILAGVSATAIMVAARWTRWLEPELLGLPSLVGPGSVCVDVGAAAGIYTLPLARLAGPTGLVHSVEPLPFAWPTWNRLLRVRSSPNVLHHAVALGSEPGEASMSVPRGRHGLVTGRSFVSQHCLGLGSNAEFAQHITYPVPVDTLDRLLAAADHGRLDFVKIDVEGAELHVLRGGAGVIESFRPAMLIEIEARHTARYQYHPEDVVSWLRARGYAMYTWNRGWQQASQITSVTRNYLFRVP